MQRQKYSSLFCYGVAVLNVLLATGLNQLLWDDLKLTPMLMFATATAITTVIGGPGAGLLAGMLSVLSFDYFFLPPYFALDLSAGAFLRVIGMALWTLGFYKPVAARKRVELQLRNTLEELEQRVTERTLQLSVSNSQLSAEIEERRRAEKQLADALAREQAARRAAETSNRLKDDFLATVSHELRTPLSAIVGWTYMLREGTVSAEQVPHALETIERNARAQTQLVNDLLDVSRIISGKIQIETLPVDLSGVIASAVGTVRLAAEARTISLEINLGENLPLITGDVRRLQQVVWNLLSNAVKFTPSGGRIQISLQQERDAVQLRISDTGQGIEPEFLPFVFDRFSQADSSYTRRHGGLGLGLAIVRHLVEMHGGSVRAESGGAGQGATFIITLPVPQLPLCAVQVTASGGRSQSDARNDRAATDLPLFGRRILIVDDEPDMRVMLAVALTRQGAIVASAGSAAEAIDKIGQRLPDLLISDIAMPGQDGYALLRQLRQRFPGREHYFPAIALTALASSEDRKRALAAGFQAHLAKPVNLTELLDDISVLLRQAAAFVTSAS